MFGGPWFISGHHLALQRWRPNFRPSTTKIEKTVVWVRFPGLPLEYYDKDVIFKIGNGIGQTIKVDLTTEHVTRGRFVRICVEIDTSKPLVPAVRTGGFNQKIEYEGVNQFCFKCGKISHKQDQCVISDVSQQGQGNDSSNSLNVVNNDTNVAGMQVHDNAPNLSADSFGPWMLVEDKSKKKKGNS